MQDGKDCAQINEFLFESSAIKFPKVEKEEVKEKQLLKNMIIPKRINAASAASSSKRKAPVRSTSASATSSSSKRKAPGESTASSSFKRPKKINDSRCSYCRNIFKGAIGVKRHLHACPIKTIFDDNNLNNSKNKGLSKDTYQILIDENSELGDVNSELMKSNEKMTKTNSNLLKNNRILRKENKKSKELYQELDYRQGIIQDKQNMINKHQKTINTLQKDIFKLKNKTYNKIDVEVQTEDLQPQIASSSSQDTSFNQLLIDVEKNIEQFCNEEHVLESPNSTSTIEIQAQYIERNYNKIHHEYVSLQKNVTILIKKRTNYKLQKSPLLLFTDHLINLNIEKQHKFHSIITKYREEYSKLIGKMS